MEALEGVEAFIAYTPMKGEADYRTSKSLMKTLGSTHAVLPQDPTEEPRAWARLLAERYKRNKVAVLIPGTRFDTKGTRHGRGGGWYDRFLSEVPAEWLRVGIARTEQISKIPLVREEWDEPVDYLYRKTGSGWRWIKTGARDV